MKDDSQPDSESAERARQRDEDALLVYRRKAEQPRQNHDVQHQMGCWGNSSASKHPEPSQQR